MQPVIHWFREDLRLEDNPALSAASDGGLPVIGLYIWDEDRSNRFKIGDAQKIWLHFSLQSLEKSLKKYSIPLLIEKGTPIEVWQNILKKISPKKVTWNRSFDRFVAQRDGKVRQLLEKHDVNVQDFNGTLLIDPSELTNQTGGFYKVFAPFLRCYPKAYEPLKVSKLHQNHQTPPLKSHSLHELHLLDKAVISPEKMLENWEPGEEGAHKQLRKFIKTSLQGYRHDRDYPGLNNTSKLSPHLHFGELSPHAIVRALSDSFDKNPFLRELVFRDFASYLLYHCPDLPTAPFKKEFEKWKWSKDKHLFDAWKDGKTGYPLVDAGMRQLLQTGFMHNRVRMVVASFLIKDLNIAWQEGAGWFSERLLDADLGNNSYNWQWSAGTGLDAQPFFRIFNPLLQSEKFDPKGIYIRQWVPELQKLPLKYLHAPWKAPAEVLQEAHLRLGKDYPLPIVDHDQAKQFALMEFKRLKK
jgi:deoxyribodipyrimidine photo-lyase